MVKKIDTNDYLDFLAIRDRLEEVIVKTAKKVLNNRNFTLKESIGKEHIIEYHKKYIEG